MAQAGILAGADRVLDPGLDPLPLTFRSSEAWCPVFWAWSRSDGVLIAVALCGAPVPEIEQSSW